MRALAGFLLGVVVALWVWTLRVRVTGELPGHSRVLGFWHGQQLLLLAARRTLVAGAPCSVLVSRSRDGDLQAVAMRVLGFRVERGSPSREGAHGLRRLLRAVRAGHHAVFAADGSRGPLRQAKGGAALLASRTQADLLPVAAFAERAITLAGTWDQFEVPLPFSRVHVVVGQPLDAAVAASDPARLTAGIELARRAARPRDRAAATVAVEARS